MTNFRHDLCHDADDGGDGDGDGDLKMALCLDSLSPCVAGDDGVSMKMSPCVGDDGDVSMKMSLCVGGDGGVWRRTRIAVAVEAPVENPHLNWGSLNAQGL